MSRFSIQIKMRCTLQWAIAMCFIGHGTFGIITKPIWCNYFAVFGMGHDMAYQLMPWLGSFDIMMGIIMLVYPVRAIPLWLVFWGTFTALLRPLSGEPLAEFIERTANFGAPLAWLILSGGIGRNSIDLFKRTNPNVETDVKTYNRALLSLRTVIFLMLAGHGWLNLIEKKALLNQYTTLGFSDAVRIAHTIGILEIIAALLVLFHPSRQIILFIFIWKITSELFYPHYEIFEWIERGGSYGVLLAYWFAMDPLFYRRVVNDLHSWNVSEIN